MIAPQQDPLRFLKKRKKQFHLTPTKQSIVNQSSQSISSVSQQILKNQNNKTSQISKDHYNGNQVNNELTKLTSKNNKQTNHIINNQNYFIKQNITDKLSCKSNFQVDLAQNKFSVTTQKSKQSQYDPLKYFSSNIQDFLRQKRNIGKKIIANSGIEKRQKLIDFQNKLFQGKQKSVRPYLGNQNQYIIPLKIQEDKKYSEPSESTIRLQDYFEIDHKQKQQDISPLIESVNKSKFKQPEIKYKQPKIRNQIYNLQQNKALLETKNSKYYQQEKQENIELEQCPTCHRKFNPNSYEKHVKVCQNVFFKKRKSFSSQKQRSQSKDQKTKKKK